MFHDAFAHLEGEIHPGKARIAILEVLDNSKGVQVMIEALPEAAHLPVQLLFTGVSEGRVADVMYQGERLSQVFIQPEYRSHCARDLRDLDGVGQAVAEVIGNTGRE